MASFWEKLIPHSHGNNSLGNTSYDVVSKGCLDVYETTACIRSSFLGFLGCLTFLFCILHTTKLHLNHHTQVHQYLVFYCASLELLCLIVKWVAINSLYQMEFLASLLKMLQFVLLCNFHWSLASRILHQQCVRIWVITPVLCGFLAFFFAITILGLMCNFSTWEDCLAPHWILLSATEFLAIQLYVVAGIYITRKINSVAAMESFKQEQKRELWSVIVSYEISSITSLIYYTTLQVLGNPEIGCSGIFNHVQEVYSFIYTLFMIMKYFLPIWVMLVAFYITDSSEEEPLLGWSREASTNSLFSREIRYHDFYRQLAFPTQDTYDPTQELRRSASFPALSSSRDLRPLIEDPILPPSRVHFTTYGATDSFRSQPSGHRRRHDSGMHACATGPMRRVPVSLNHCADEVESVTPSSNERSTHMN